VGGLCHVPGQRVRDAQNVSHVLGTYRLLIDPDRLGSSLPPDLYFLLTNGRARWAKTSVALAAVAESSKFDLATALRIGCIDVAGLRICERDMPHFEMGGIRVPSERDAIVLGSTYFNSNTTQVAMDGWTQQLTLQLATPEQAFSATVQSGGGGSGNALAVQWLCFAMAAGGIVLYSRWINYPATPNVGMLVKHLYDHQFEALGQRWPLDHRMTLNLIFLILHACGSTLVVTLAYAYLPTGGSDTGSPYWQMLVLGLLVFGLVQTVLSVAAAFLADRRLPQQRKAWCCQSPWFAPVVVSIQVAWLRHLTQGTASLAFTCAVLVPVAYDGSVSGSMILLFIPLLPALALLYHQAYYVIGFTSLMASGLRNVRGQFLWLAILAAIEVLLLLGLVAVVAVFYVVPVIDASSPFFPQAFTYLVVMMLLAMVVAGAGIWILGEVRLAMDKCALTSTS
jgi:hypothetical protein